MAVGRARPPRVTSHLAQAAGRLPLFPWYRALFSSMPVSFAVHAVRGARLRPVAAFLAETASLLLGLLFGLFWASFSTMPGRFAIHAVRGARPRPVAAFLAETAQTDGRTVKGPVRPLAEIAEQRRGGFRRSRYMVPKRIRAYAQFLQLKISVIPESKLFYRGPCLFFPCL